MRINTTIFPVGVLAGLILFSSTVKGQDVQPLLLNEAIKMGLAYNKSIAINNAHVTEAEAMLQAAKDARLPGFTVTGSYLRLTNANISLQNKNNAGGTTPNENPSPNSAIYGIANATLPLYTGGKLRYNLERSSLLLKAAELDIESTKENVAFSVLNAYANVYKTSKLINIIRENYEASLSRDSSLSSLERNGIIARNDLLKAQLHTSELQLNLLEANSNHELAISQLNILLGRGENDTIIIDENFSDSLPSILPYDDYLSLAMLNRQDKQSAAFRINAAESGIKMAQAQVYPNISLTGGYIAADIPGVIKITNAVNLGLGVQYNLSNLWKKNTELITAKARETEARATSDIINDNIRIALVTEYRAYLLSTQKIELYKKTLEQAQENFRITKNKYDNNLSTVNDLLDAEVYVTQSKINKELASADEFLKYKKLLFTTGTLNY